jgi:UDP-N-acetylmuramoyl-L-alanyl-D-glutamate--2,6-diaminopimelate ligase
VKGRLEMHTQTGRATAVIDYAHTPDALEKALTALRSFCSGKLWVVFGCGGDRDKTKRPLMAEVAERLADVVVVTEDNARTECRANIVKDIVAGLQQPEKAHIKPNRKVAIQFALAHAALGDMVLLAGKGHETTLNIRGRLYHFDERQFL